MTTMRPQPAVRPPEVVATHRAGGAARWTAQASPPDPPPVPSCPWERAAHLAVGIGFGAAAIGNVIAFLPRARELLPWFADTAWLPPYSWLLHHLLPAAPLVVTTAAALEATIAAMLLSRRHVPTALGLAAAWTIGLIPAVGWPYFTANLGIGAVLTMLGVRAYRSPHHPLEAQVQP